MASGDSLMDANTKGIKHEPEESGSLISWVWLEVVEVDLDDEGRSDGGEQTGLKPKSVRTHPSNVDDLQISARPHWTS